MIDFLLNRNFATNLIDVFQKNLKLQVFSDFCSSNNVFSLILKLQVFPGFQVFSNPALKFK